MNLQRIRRHVSFVAIRRRDFDTNRMASPRDIKAADDDSRARRNIPDHRDLLAQRTETVHAGRTRFFRKRIPRRGDVQLETIGSNMVGGACCAVRHGYQEPGTQKNHAQQVITGMPPHEAPRPLRHTGLFAKTCRALSRLSIDIGGIIRRIDPMSEFEGFSGFNDGVR